MNNLKPCPCGEVPTKLTLWGRIYTADCCGEWFRRAPNKVFEVDNSKAAFEILHDHWNTASRGDE